MKASVLFHVVISCCIMLVSCGGKTVNYAPETERMLEELDLTLKDKAVYEDAKQQRIKAIRTELSGLRSMTDSQMMMSEGTQSRL